MISEVRLRISHADIHQVRDGGDRLFLQDGRRTEQSAGRDEQDIAQASAAHIAKDMSAQYRCAAAAAGTAGMDVLIFAEDHHAAVFVPGHKVYPSLEHQIMQQARADSAEVAGEDRVIVVHIRVRRREESFDGVRRGRC